MPVLDRFWWLRLFRAAIFAIFALVAGDVLWGMLTDPSIRSAGGIAGATFVLLVFAGYAAYMVAESLTARRRKRLRLAVLRGEAVDLLRARQASPPVTAALPATGADLPLRLLWRETWFWRAVRGISSMVPVITLYGLLTIIAGTRVVPIPFPAGLPQAHVTPTVAIAMACLVALIVVIADGRPYGVIADEEGIHEWRRVGRTRLVRWSEARLLEVGEPKWRQTDRTYVYALYSTRTYVAWHWPKTQLEAALDATRDESTARSRALLALVEERTGLVPRILEFS